jgi:DNA modification methylase
MIADAMLDTTQRGDLVLDFFLGSGTAVIAAQKIGRRTFGMEIDPVYVDVIVRRWQAWTGEVAIHAETGLAFEAIAAGRAGGADAAA